MRGRPDGTPGKTLSQTDTMSTQPDLLTTPETLAPELERARTEYAEAFEMLDLIECECEGDDTGLAIASARVKMRNARERLEKLELEAMK